MTAIPIGEVLIDIGNVPQWFIAGAAALGLYKVWKSERHIVEVLEKIEQVHYETKSMRSALELASRAEGRLAGRQEMRVEVAEAKETAKEVARTDAVADAKMHADVLAADPNSLTMFPASVGVIIAEAAKSDAIK
jgi:hypothetical protein